MYEFKVNRIKSRSGPQTAAFVRLSRILIQPTTKWEVSVGKVPLEELGVVKLLLSSYKNMHFEWE